MHRSFRSNKYKSNPCDKLAPPACIPDSPQFIHVSPYSTLTITTPSLPASCLLMPCPCRLVPRAFLFRLPNGSSFRYFLLSFLSFTSLFPLSFSNLPTARLPSHLSYQASTVDSTSLLSSPFPHLVYRHRSLARFTLHAALQQHAAYQSHTCQSDTTTTPSFATALFSLKPRAAVKPKPIRNTKSKIKDQIKRDKIKTRPSLKSTTPAEPQSQNYTQTLAVSPYRPRIPPHQTIVPSRPD